MTFDRFAILSLETQGEVGNRLELVTSQQAQVFIRDAQDVGRMINGLVSRSSIPNIRAAVELIPAGLTPPARPSPDS